MQYCHVFACLRFPETVGHITVLLSVIDVYQLEIAYSVEKYWLINKIGPTHFFTWAITGRKIKSEFLITKKRTHRVKGQRSKRS